MNLTLKNLRVTAKDPLSITFEAGPRDGDFVPLKASCDWQGCTHVWLNHRDGDEAKKGSDGDYIHVCELKHFIDILSHIDSTRREHFTAEGYAEGWMKEPVL